MASGVESLGLAENRDQLEREAAGAVPPELSEQIEGQLGNQLAQVTSWSQITGDGVDILAACFLPAWHLSDTERKRLSEKLARMLDLLCPVRMSPVIEAVVGCALCVGGITASRMLQNGGRLPRIGPILPAAEPAPNEPAPPAQPPLEAGHA